MKKTKKFSNFHRNKFQNLLEIRSINNNFYVTVKGKYKTWQFQFLIPMDHFLILCSTKDKTTASRAAVGRFETSNNEEQ